MAALPDLVTVAQFREMPEKREFRYELHHGEVVPVSGPKPNHIHLQRHLMDLLRPRLRAFELFVELAFRAVSEFDVRIADVGAVALGRWNTARREDDLFGAPELVIEVKSPSNRERELRERASLCLSNGCFEFWIVDDKVRSISVLHRDGSSTVYRPGDSIPLAAFGSDSISVDDIFA